MTYEELFSFFQMHGENIQLKRGRTVRGVNIATYFSNLT